MVGDDNAIQSVAAKISKNHKLVNGLSFTNISLGARWLDPLCIEEMNLNQQNPLHQSHEFIVTCLAAGGPGMKFTWYKDDYLVDTRLADRYMKAVEKDIRPLDGLGLLWRASVLTITKARKFDSGVFRLVFKGFFLL